MVKRISQFDRMLNIGQGQLLSDWQKLKQEPKKPTNSEVKQYLEHVIWLKSWSADLPTVTHIPIVKRNQYMYEARALDAADMRNLQQNKRYALMVILCHAQLGKVLDDAVEMFIKKLRKLNSVAEEQLQAHYLEHQKRAEKLVAQLRDVLEAFQAGESNDGCH